MTDLADHGVVYINKARLQEWAKAVRARDGRCLDCGSKDDLHAHHVLTKSARPDLALDMENGKTLCYRCHKAEHERNKQPRRKTVVVRVHRRTQERILQEQIDALTNELSALRSEVAALRKKTRECDRGVCSSGMELTAMKNFNRWVA